MIRQNYIAKRRQMSARDVHAKSERITRKLQSSIEWTQVRSVHIYRSQASLNEVDTSAIVEFIRESWSHIDVTVGDPSPTAELPSAKYDSILVPVVAFDAQRNRLGFGGGWYDRFLAIQPQAVAIGLAYDFQQVDSIPVDTHDVRLSHVITECDTF